MGANLMAGRPQKDDARYTHNRSVKNAIPLPAGGYTGPIPAWPLDRATSAEQARWEWLWRTPQATRWAQLRIDDLVARYVRNCILLEGGAALTVAQAYLVSEVRQQEDRLGRSPLAMLRMRWDVVTDAVDTPSEQRAPVRRLRAIDPEVAASGG